MSSLGVMVVATERRSSSSSNKCSTHVTCFNPVTAHLLISLNERVEFVKARRGAADCPHCFKAYTNKLKKQYN